MATTKKNKPVKKAEWRGYHKINLTREQNQVFEEQYLPRTIPFTDFDILVNNGYKLSISWDSHNHGVSAALYAQSEKMEWAGYSLTAWSGDAETALKLLLYKHYVVAQQRWEIVNPEREGSDVKWG
jgi:hypothetical protein